MRNLRGQLPLFMYLQSVDVCPYWQVTVSRQALSLDHMPSVPMSSQHPAESNSSPCVICCEIRVDGAVLGGLVKSGMFIVSSNCAPVWELGDTQPSERLVC